MNHLESITEKLHALLPELRELSFGCRILFQPDGFADDQSQCVVVVTNVWRDAIEVTDEPGTNDSASSYRYQKDAPEFIKILGHHITLEHVLKALGILNKHYALSYEGRFIHLQLRTTFVKLKPQESIYSGLNALIEETDYRWAFDLPLHMQSPDLWQFLDNLLPEPDEE